MRPEGQDDLELRWVDPATSRLRRRYHQIKKATDGDPDAAWSLAEVARVLLGSAVANLQGNLDEQVCVLGDRLAADVEQLLAAGRDAPERQRATYLTALHRLAKAEASITEGLDDKRLKHRLDHWNPTSQQGAIVQDFGGALGLIAARELPRDRTTLLVRLMAAGPLLASAVPEVARLPADAAERAVAEPILLQFERMLGQQATRTSDEQEFLTAMQHTWEDARTESRTETQAKAVLTVLRVRRIAVPDAARQRIQAERDLARLERWHERAIVASSIAEVIDDDPSATR